MQPCGDPLMKNVGSPSSPSARQSARTRSIAAGRSSWLGGESGSSRSPADARTRRILPVLDEERGVKFMKKLVVGLAAACALVWVGAASAGWNDTFPLNQVASSPTQGGGYPIPAGSNAPVPGTCRPGLQLQPLGIVDRGQARDRGSASAPRSSSSTRTPPSTSSTSARTRCPTATPSPTTRSRATTASRPGTQEMPPSWTNNTDPNVDFDTQGRAYQVDVAVQRLLGQNQAAPERRDRCRLQRRPGRHWVNGNGGRQLERTQRLEQAAGARRGQAVGRRQRDSVATGTRITSTRCGRSSTAAPSRSVSRSP